MGHDCKVGQKGQMLCIPDSNFQKEACRQCHMHDIWSMMVANMSNSRPLTPTVRFWLLPWLSMAHCLQSYLHLSNVPVVEQMGSHIVAGSLHSSPPGHVKPT